MSEIDERPVLIAYDGSECARAAIEQTAALLGSTAEGVLHHAHRPVLVVSGE